MSEPSDPFSPRAMLRPNLLAAVALAVGLVVVVAFAWVTRDQPSAADEAACRAAQRATTTLGEALGDEPRASAVTALAQGAADVLAAEPTDSDLRSGATTLERGATRLGVVLRAAPPLDTAAVEQFRAVALSGFSDVVDACARLGHDLREPSDAPSEAV